MDRSLPEYMAIYDIEADDLQTVFDGLRKAVVDGRIHMTDTLQTDPKPTAVVYEEPEP